MATAGIVLKPLTTAETQKSRSLSGPAPSKGKGQIRDLAFNDAIFEAELAQGRQTKEFQAKEFQAKDVQSQVRQAGDQQGNPVSPSSPSNPSNYEGVSQGGGATLGATDTQKLSSIFSEDPRPSPGSGMLSHGMNMLLNMQRDTGAVAADVTQAVAGAARNVVDKAMGAYATAQRSIQYTMALNSGQQPAMAGGAGGLAAEFTAPNAATAQSTGQQAPIQSSVQSSSYAASSGEGRAETAAFGSEFTSGFDEDPFEDEFL